MEKKSKEMDQAQKPEAGDKEQGVLYLGIDLGTSRTSIAASNGLRESTFSVVGYPKDVVSKKLLKKEALFGDEAVRHRLSLNFYRPLEKGVIKGSDGTDGIEDRIDADGIARTSREVLANRRSPRLTGSSRAS